MGGDIGADDIIPLLSAQDIRYRYPYYAPGEGGMP